VPLAGPFVALKVRVGPLTAIWVMVGAGMIVLVAVRKVQARRLQDDIDALDIFEDDMLAGGSHDTTVDEHQK
jgi:hypothetical protein